MLHIFCLLLQIHSLSSFLSHRVDLYGCEYTSVFSSLYRFSPFSSHGFINLSSVLFTLGSEVGITGLCFLVPLYKHICKLCMYHSVQFSSVAQSCPTLCDPMNHSMPGLPVHHQLPEFTQTHVH